MPSTIPTNAAPGDPILDIHTLMLYREIVKNDYREEITERRELLPYRAHRTLGDVVDECKRESNAKGPLIKDVRTEGGVGG